MKLKVVIGLIFISLLTGCEADKGNTRCFKIMSYEKHGNIVYDTRTGVEYWCSTYGALTPLVDEDGKLLIYDRSEVEE
jgi:hypothetical protein